MKYLNQCFSAPRVSVTYQSFKCLDPLSDLESCPLSLGISTSIFVVRNSYDVHLLWKDTQKS